jgi:predicted Na+-dependent transporter
MMPFWISLFGANLVQAINPSVKVLIPYRKMLISLCAMILPLFVGLLIAKFRPNWAAKMRKVRKDKRGIFHFSIPSHFF